jgi:hypothetical protein
MRPEEWQEAVAASMTALAAEATEWAATKMGEELDYSEASLAAVERCLQARSRTGAPRILGIFPRQYSPGDQRALARRLGAYVGEVYRQHHGGAWRAGTPGSARDIQLQLPDGNLTDPVAQAMRRLSSGPEQSIVDYYRRLSGPVG